jgi:hypothetical protein
MKNSYLFTSILMVVNIVRLYKLFNMPTYVSPYGTTYNSTTFFISTGMVLCLIYVCKDTHLRIASIFIMLSIVFEYAARFASNYNYAFCIIGMLAVLASIGVLINFLITMKAPPERENQTLGGSH